MNKYTAAIIMATTILSSVHADARPSSRSGFSSGYSRSSSSYGYSASRSAGYSSYSAPRSTYVAPSYSAPRTTYSAPTTTYHSSTTVVNNHTSSGGGFGSSFVGGMAGAMVGNALTDHDRGGYVAAPVATPAAPVVADPAAPADDYGQPATVVYHETNSGVPIWPFVILGGFAALGAFWWLRKPSANVKRAPGIVRGIAKRRALYKENPNLIVGTRVNIPQELGEDGTRSFVMDSVGSQRATAIGKNDAYCHFYLGGEIDQDFVRAFLGSSDGGEVKEAWAFSNVANFYGGSEMSGDFYRVSQLSTSDGVWISAYTGAFYDAGTETIIDESGKEIVREYVDFLFRRGDELLLVRLLGWNDPDGTYARAARYFAGVEIPTDLIG